MRLFDSHAHLTDDRFADDLEATLLRAKEAGVTSIVTIASDIEDARAAAKLAAASHHVRLGATAGTHPHQADGFDHDALDVVRSLAAEGAILAVGETGLDFYYDNSARAAQVDAFRAQLELASELDLPIVVHSRDADSETAAAISDFAGRVRGVLHCFTGGDDLLETGARCDWYVSFSGIVTFKSFENVDRIRRVPRDRLLVETDSPYLAPVPNRGKRNEPANVVHVLERVAAVRGEDAASLAEATYRNACRFYGIPAE